MKEYVKPALLENDLVLEGVYAASGDDFNNYGDDNLGGCGKDSHPDQHPNNPHHPEWGWGAGQNPHHGGWH